MTNLSNLYNVNENLSGVARGGYCRPTLAELWSSSKDYNYPWCTVQPIYTVLNDEIVDNLGEKVVKEGM